MFYKFIIVIIILIFFSSDVAYNFVLIFIYFVYYIISSIMYRSWFSSMLISPFYHLIQISRHDVTYTLNVYIDLKIEYIHS